MREGEFNSAEVAAMLDVLADTKHIPLLTSAATLLRELAATNQKLTEALTDIRDMTPEPRKEFDHPKDCAECERWRKMKHPIQRSCDGWYREKARVHNDEIRKYNWQQSRMRDIARAALTEEG